MKRPSSGSPHQHTRRPVFYHEEIVTLPGRLRLSAPFQPQAKFAASEIWVKSPNRTFPRDGTACARAGVL
jgi:hypothetical protein